MYTHLANSSGAGEQNRVSNIQQTLHQEAKPLCVYGWYQNVKEGSLEEWKYIVKFGLDTYVRVCICIWYMYMYANTYRYMYTFARTMHITPYTYCMHAHACTHTHTHTHTHTPRGCR